MNNFKADFDRIIKKAKGRIDIVVKKTALQVFDGVILKSPVDTGRFRGNWMATVGSPSFMYYDDIKDKSGRKSMAAAESVVMEYAVGNIVYLVNNLPYAQRLEYGYSKQAPKGMVRLSVAEFEQWLEKAARY